MKRQLAQVVRATTPQGDSQIVARLARGDMGALGELYDLYAASLLRFVHRVSPGSDAEDVVQATFLRVVRIAGTFDPKATSARPWLFAIAARLIQERGRAMRRLAVALASFANHPRSPNQQKAGASTDFERAVAQLSEPKRMVLLLAEVEGFSCDEIASMLTIPVGTVWTRLHHARLELRKFFGEEA